MDRGNIPITIYLDLSKAFDTLDHNFLLSNLEYYGIKNSELSLFKNYILNRKQFVQMGEISSTTQTIKTGVPQGSILGPLLFVIYINDLPVRSDFFKFIIYADDTTLFCSLNPRNFDKIEDLSIIINRQIQLVNNWLKVNKLSLNNKKSKFMVFKFPQRIVNIPDLYIEETKIESVTYLNFLGNIIQSNLKWENHINAISIKISRIIGILSKLKNILPFDILKMLYCNLIVPHLFYGILLWGYSTSRLLKLQKKTIRTITCSRCNAHTDPIFKQLTFLKLDDIYQLQ